ncbi:glycosyltransferase family 2 protein [Legionella yabuuchiae]|uniref:glycosyltransferase family 2 protein n=1 Tax=Legionella yabuuchiae TaxID=376727 RepID=UPI0010562E45|nr:glycosyltransferase [Legionella yabuuchiae]
MITILMIINYAILIFFIFSAIIYTLILLGSLPSIFYFFKRANITNIYSLLQTKEMPPVTIITPFYNEEEIIIENVLSSLKSDYENLYITLVNDGSTDASLKQLIEYFEMRPEPVTYSAKIATAPIKHLYVSSKNPRLLVIDKEHSGVGDSLNAGLNACFTPYFMTVDADSIIDKEAVAEMMYQMLSRPNTVAIGGGVYILNNCEYKNGEMEQVRMPYRYIPALQSAEYLRSHLFNRTGWNVYKGTMSYSGTASLFRLADVIAAKGYDTENYAQDSEMIMRLHHYMHSKKKTYNIGFNPSSTVWTRVPNTLVQFSRQRERWQRGILRSILSYRDMFFNARFKIQGLFSYPMYVILEAIAPFVEFTAYFTLTLAYFMGILNATSAILYILLAWGFIAYLTIANMFINIITFNRYHRINDILWMFALAVLEMIGFRQYHTIVKVWGSFHYFINRVQGKPL